MDPAAMRRQLGRRGCEQIASHVIWQEARSRLEDRLSYIRCAPQPRLDHGVAEYGAPMQIDPGSLNLIWSVGLLAYLADMRSTLGFWAHSLAPGGLVMLATLGPDSFRGLSLALGDAAQQQYLQGYPDMHHIGDALMAAGLSDPVMDAEWITLTYSDPGSALADLRALGGNALSGRSKGLRGRAWRDRLFAAIESLRQDGRICLKVELVFGHAWKLAPADRSRPAPGEPQPIRFAGRTPKESDSGI
jgi:malonyl-CoA O-methyltransferase